MVSDLNAKARRRSAAYRAASEGKSLEILSDFWIEEGVAPIDNRGDTILHFLAVNGNVAGFEILDPLLKTKDLEITNNSGDTPLHEAARFGKKDFVEMILKKEKDLVLIRNEVGETPLYVAAASGEKQVFNLLAKYDFSELTMKRDDGKTVLHATVLHDCFDLAIDIVDRYPDIVNERDDKDMTALNILATKKSAFRSGSDYLFGEIGKTPSVPVQMIETIIYSCISARHETQSGTKVVPVKRFSFTKSLLGYSWLQVIDEAKQKHELALSLSKMLLENYDWSYAENVPNPLIQAANLKIEELVLEILEMYPEAVETVDEQGRNILHIAAEHKNRFLFGYLLKNTAVSKERMAADIDKEGNTVLHSAANIGEPYRTATTEHIESVWCVMSVLMMMWGVLWFKYVKYNVHPRLWNVRNSKGVTAEELFEKNHLHIRKEAEEATRNLSNSTLVLSTLLCTINFAAIFTVPGGYNEDTGLPILLDKVQKELWMLMFYLGAALFSSVFTMGTLLSFLLCKFYSNDFYISLPVKIIIAIISVFYATAFTILGCLQALNLENIVLNKDVWWLIIAVIAVGFIMTLIYVDLAFPMFDYVYYLVYYSFFVSYKRGHM